jgi:hypothetical protein
VKFAVIRVIKLCSDVAEYQRFGGLFQGELKQEISPESYA